MRLPDDIELRRLTSAAAHRARWERWLSEAERTRYRSFPSAKRRREFLLGRAALRTLLAERTGIEPARVVVHVTSAGAVEAPDTPYYVSITHSGDRAVAALGERRVGVDLERISARADAVADFLLHPDERDLIETLPMANDAAFTLCWTLKEAVLKALGTGMRHSPKKLRLDIDPGTCSAGIEAWNGSRWQARYEEQAGFFLSVAYAPEGSGGERS